eukprot:SM000001S04798  [mRNA]  locus=s1:2233345:2238292:- [translate_table: standard]
MAAADAGGGAGRAPAVAVGVGALALEDVFAVAVLGHAAVPDAAALARLARSVGTAGEDGGGFAKLDIDGDGGGVEDGHDGPPAQPALPPEQARAVATAVLAALLRGGPGRGVRPALVNGLAALLGASGGPPPPTLPAADGDLAVLAALAAILAAAPSGVTAAEHRALLETAAASAGVAALAVHDARVLLRAADGVAALSCEALQAYTAALDLGGGAEGPVHKSQAEAASELRALLAGSKLVNPRKDGVSLAAINALPQCHGLVREALKSVAGSVKAELSGATDAADAASNGKLGSTFIPCPLVATHVTGLLRSLVPLASSSVRRTSKVIEVLSRHEAQPGGELSAAELSGALGIASETVAAIQSAADEVSSAISAADLVDGGGLPAVLAARKCVACLDLARELSALEAVASLQLLKSREASTAARSAGKDASDTAPRAEVGAGEQRKGGGVGRGKEGSGKKGKGGNTTGGGGSGLLGKGTALVRQYLEGVLQGVRGSGLTAQVEALDGALDAKSESMQEHLVALQAALESNEARRVPKIPKGTRDFLPDQMAIREKAFVIITAVFKRHGGVALDTPVFELRETLMGKYGEDSKLIYDLADQGGEILSLRYDLTVPFARYLAMHSVGNIKRYHIARVYRRDNPQMNQGRYREFYQCDFDIAGTYIPMVPDAEILKVITEILEELSIGEFEIKLNHRRLLDGMLDICGVPPTRFRAICSAIDKLDKESWEDVRAEMVNEKGLPVDVADRIGTFVSKRGEPLSLLQELRSPDGPFAGHKESLAALEDLFLLFGYLQSFQCLGRIVFDLSLARGLDYYTGVIYEAVFKGESQVGSIAAGGRYDNLVGMFCGKQVPAVGVSLGIERVFSIMEDLECQRSELIRSTQTEVLIASIGPDLLRKRMELCTKLWAAGIKAEFVFAASPNLQKQLEFANKQGIPWMVLFGSDELDKGEVKIKDLIQRTESSIAVDSLVAVLQDHLRTSRPNREL